MAARTTVAAAAASLPREGCPRALSSPYAFSPREAPRWGPWTWWGCLVLAIALVVVFAIEEYPLTVARLSGFGGQLLSFGGLFVGCMCFVNCMWFVSRL